MLHSIGLGKYRFHELVRRRSFVLLYHRIAAVKEDPWNLCVSPRNFCEQLEVLAKVAGPVIPLRKLIEERGKEPSVAITFDDGYADNLTAARPILEANNIPATFFISTDYINASREYFWDDLAKAILSKLALPATLKLDVGSRRLKWITSSPTDRVARKKLYLSLWTTLVELQPSHRDGLMDEISKWAHSSPTIRDLYCTLTSGQLARLADSALVEIGAHTASHSVLPALPPALRMLEMKESKRVLQEITDMPITVMAYPYGRYDDATIISVRESGFAAAFTTEFKHSSSFQSPFAIPRICIENWNGAEFEKRLSVALKAP